MTFAELLRQYRTEKGLTQQQLADLLFVDRTTIVKWESGDRMPDSYMLSRIAKTFDLDPGILLNVSKKSDEKLNVILLDDEKVILKGAMPVLEKAFPSAVITGFDKPSEAVKFAEKNRVDLAFIDITLGNVSGLDICRQLLKINPFTNVIFLTAFIYYAFDAWSTGACGFILKPLTVEKIENQLSRLRYPFGGGVEPKC